MCVCVDVSYVCVCMSLLHARARGSACGYMNIHSPILPPSTPSILPQTPTRYQAGRSKKEAKQAGLSRRKAELERNLEIGAVSRTSAKNYHGGVWAYLARLRLCWWCVRWTRARTCTTTAHPY